MNIKQQPKIQGFPLFSLIDNGRRRYQLKSVSNTPANQSITVMLFLCVCLLLSHNTFAQDDTELYDVLDAAQEVLDSVIKDVTNGDYELPYELTTADEFEQAFMDFQNVLGSGDLESMAKWFPHANQLMTYVGVTPGLEPYADWLRQRLDYAAVANDAVSTIAPTQPQPETIKLRPQPQVNSAPPESVPEKSATKQPQPETQTPGSTNSNLQVAYARDATTWSKKLEGREAVQTAEKLVPSLKKMFLSKGVPAELVWMAEVESTFNPAARSPAGAVGLFQLMPATAKHLGLQIEPVDQRLDPSKNGHAAAKYLKDLYDRFEDWPLAIAAYNGGEGRISKLLKANNANNLEAISDQLPSQTQMYVPKVLATIRLREGYDPSTRW